MPGEVAGSCRCEEASTSDAKWVGAERLQQGRGKRSREAKSAGRDEPARLMTKEKRGRKNFLVKKRGRRKESHKPFQRKPWDTFTSPSRRRSRCNGRNRTTKGKGKMFPERPGTARSRMGPPLSSQTTEKVWKIEHYLKNESTKGENPRPVRWCDGLGLRKSERRDRCRRTEWGRILGAWEVATVKKKRGIQNQITGGASGGPPEG